MHVIAKCHLSKALLPLPVQYIVNLYCSPSLWTPPWPAPFFSVTAAIPVYHMDSYYRVPRRVSSMNKSDHAILLIKTLLWLSFEIKMKCKLSPLPINSYIISTLLCSTLHILPPPPPCSLLLNHTNLISLSRPNQTHSYFMTFYTSSGPLMSQLFLYFVVLPKMSLP